MVGAPVAAARTLYTPTRHPAHPAQYCNSTGMCRPLWGSPQVIVLLLVKLIPLKNETLQQVHDSIMTASLQVDSDPVCSLPSIADALDGLDVKRALQGDHCLPLLHDPQSYRASTFDWLDASCVAFVM